MMSPRLITAIRAVSLGTTTLILGMLFAHLLELPPKRELAYGSYLVVQQNLYRDWGPAASVLEPLALLSTGLLAFLLWRARRPGTAAVVVAALGQLIALVLFFAVVNPVNTKQAGWTAAVPPADWQHVRDLWEYGHAVRGLLYAVAFALILATILNDARRAVLRAPVDDARSTARSRS